jgi:hypothetical protein
MKLLEDNCENSPLLGPDNKMGTKRAREHDVLFICMSVIVTVVLIMTLFVNALSGSIGVDIGKPGSTFLTYDHWVLRLVQNNEVPSFTKFSSDSKLTGHLGNEWIYLVINWV